MDAAKADGRWAAAYAPPSEAEVPADLLAAIAADPAAQAMFDVLTKTNRFALIHRVNAVKRAETRERKIGEFVAMLARHETIYPQKAKPPNSPRVVDSLGRWSALRRRCKRVLLSGGGVSVRHAQRARDSADTRAVVGRARRRGLLSRPENSRRTRHRQRPPRPSDLASGGSDSAHGEAVQDPGGN